MSESQSQPNVELKSQTLTILVFIHQKLVATAFYPEEFAQADKALKMIAEMAQALDRELHPPAPVPEPVEQVAPNKRTRKPKQV